MRKLLLVAGIALSLVFTSCGPTAATTDAQPAPTGIATSPGVAPAPAPVTMPLRNAP